MSSRGEGDVSVDVLESIAYTISIHALRVEGDREASDELEASLISIHALRVEGDPTLNNLFSIPFDDFYPRPPGGGRRGGGAAARPACRFLSTPSGWRATRNLMPSITPSSISIHALRVEGDVFRQSYPAARQISIHALRVEGDKRLKNIVRGHDDFYPRPPGGGRQTDLKRTCTRQNFYPRPPGGGRHSS